MKKTLNITLTKKNYLKLVFVDLTHRAYFKKYAKRASLYLLS